LREVRREGEAKIGWISGFGMVIARGDGDVIFLGDKRRDICNVKVGVCWIV
jgi:hypothetical protein